MFSLAYTTPIALRSQLNILISLRSQILSVALSRQQERTLYWQTKQESIAASLRLAGTHATTPLAYQQAINLIEDEWTAREKPVEFPTIETFARFTHTSLNQKQAIQKFLNYLNTQEEQPIIQAALAVGFLSASIFPANDSGLLPRLLSRLFLAKHGYDVRGLVSPERQWLLHEDSYRNTLTESSKRENMTEWLLYFVNSLENEYTRCLKDIKTQSVPVKTRRFSQRQLAIIHLLDNPEQTITNRDIQKQCKLSQITASRELSRLTLLGILTSHGKGRSVSYSRR